MPQFIEPDPEAVKSGKIRLVKPAEPKPPAPPAPPTPNEVLKAISDAISRLGDLQTATLKLIQSSRAEPDAMMAVMTRVAELSQQVPPVVNIHSAPPWNELDFTIHRDGFGRMNKVSVKREESK
jgi:hypothetical protein